VVTIKVAGYEEWRQAARELVERAIAPDVVAWLPEEDQSVLPFPDLAGADLQAAKRTSVPRVPRAFVSLAETVACHRNPSQMGRPLRPPVAHRPRRAARAAA
jgi:DNA polymerase